MAIIGLRHIGLKVMSIALAALLWLAVAGEQIVERALRIPLEFTNMPPQLEPIGEPPDVVDVRVRGSSGRLSRIAAGEIVAVVDLEGARPGQRLFHVSGSDVRAPFGVEVMQVAPSSLYLTFEPSATKSVPVMPEVEGEPAAGFEIATRAAEPATVDVIGPQSAIAAMTTAITEPVSVAGASAPVVEMVSVGVSDPSVRLKSTEPVRVTVTVRPAPLQWAVQGVPVKVLNANGRATVSPTAVTIHVRGPRDAMGADAGSFDASVDVTGLKPGDYELPVRIAIPPRVGWTRIEPANVRVRIR
jgi:YbbR domain-containing protein